MYRINTYSHCPWKEILFLVFQGGVTFNFPTIIPSRCPFLSVKLLCETLLLRQGQIISQKMMSTAVDRDKRVGVTVACPCPGPLCELREVNSTSPESCHPGKQGYGRAPVTPAWTPLASLLHLWSLAGTMDSEKSIPS